MGVVVNKYESLIRLIITSVVMIAIPFALMGVIFGAMCLRHTETMAGITYTAYGLGFLLGSLSHLIAIICGLFKSCFLTFVENIKTFFSDMSISVKMAFKYMFYNFMSSKYETFFIKKIKIYLTL